MSSNPSIYQQLVGATDEDSAYYFARQTHRSRNDVPACQVFAAVSDAIAQYRNGRIEFARTLAGIIETFPLSAGDLASTQETRARLAELYA